MNSKIYMIVAHSRQDACQYADLFSKTFVPGTFVVGEYDSCYPKDQLYAANNAVAILSPATNVLLVTPHEVAFCALRVAVKEGRLSQTQVEFHCIDKLGMKHVFTVDDDGYFEVYPLEWFAIEDDLFKRLL